MPGGIGPMEIVIVLIIALIIVGPKKLPDMGRSLGTGMREFKDSVTGSNRDHDDRPALSAVETKREAAA